MKGDRKYNKCITGYDELGHVITYKDFKKEKYELNKSMCKKKLKSINDDLKNKRMEKVKEYYVLAIGVGFSLAAINDGFVEEDSFLIGLGIATSLLTVSTGISFYKVNSLKERRKKIKALKEQKRKIKEIYKKNIEDELTNERNFLDNHKRYVKRIN